MRTHPQVTSRLHTLARGLAALLALTAVIIVLPILLVKVAGSPLPSGLPTGQQLRSVLSRPADDTIILAVLRDVAWLLWAAFCASTALEATAFLRGRHAPHLPGLGSVQQLAGKLVTSVILMVHTPGAAALVAATAPAATVTTVAEPTAGADTFTDASLSPVAAPHHGAGHTYTVRPGDSLWEIAKKHLGDPERWRDIAALNTHLIDDPRVIRPGWQLQMPPKHPHHSPAGHHAHAGQRHGSGHGDVHRSASPTPAQPQTPGEQTAPTTSPQPAETGQGAPQVLQPTQPAASVTPLSPHEQPAVHAAPSEEGTSVAPMAAVFATGMLAGGVLATLAQMRARQRQHRRRGRRIRLPADDRPHGTERRMAYQAFAEGGGEAGVWLRAALRALCAGVRRDGLESPPILGVHMMAQGQLEVLLAEPAPRAPAPFVVVEGSRDMCWQLTDPTTLPSGDGTDPLPGLVTVGRTDHDGQLLIDLEALRVVGCAGPQPLVDAVLRTLATEAATNPYNGWYDAILVGFDELEATQGRVYACADLTEALELLAGRAEAIRARLADGEDVRDQRLADGDDDDLQLTLLISRTPADTAQLDRLLATIDDTGGLAAVLPVAGEEQVPARFTLATDDSGQVLLHIDPLQLTVHPQPLHAGDYDDIVALLSAAADTSDVSVDHPAYTQPHIPPSADTTDDADDISVDAEVAPTDRGAPTAFVPFTFDSRVFPTGQRAQPAAGSSAADAEQEQDDHEHAATAGAADPGPDHDPDDRTPTGPAAPPAEVERQGLSVQVLGPLQVDGAAGDLQPKHVEILLVLALNPAGLRNDQLRTLLGPDADHPKTSDSLRQAISRARRRLGRTADGNDYIEYVNDGVYQGIYRLRDTELDWLRFQQIVEDAIATDPPSARLLRQALDLVRGRPLEGVYHWWIDTPMLETMRAAIVDAAELLAELDLAGGAAASAGRAARKGLTADPAAEQLWRMVMRAEHQAGTSAGVREAWQGCLRELAAIDEDLEPHPDTVALYHTLTGRPAQPSTRLAGRP